MSYLEPFSAIGQFLSLITNMWTISRKIRRSQALRVVDYYFDTDRFTVELADGREIRIKRETAIQCTPKCRQQGYNIYDYQPCGPYSTYTVTDCRIERIEAPYYDSSRNKPGTVCFTTHDLAPNLRQDRLIEVVYKDCHSIYIDKDQPNAPPRAGFFEYEVRGPNRSLDIEVHFGDRKCDRFKGVRVYRELSDHSIEIDPKPSYNDDKITWKIEKPDYLALFRLIWFYKAGAPALPQDVFIRPGTDYDAYQQLRALFATARDEVLIIDRWIDNSLLDLVRLLPVDVRVRILTENRPPDFNTALGTFRRQWRGSIQVRLSSAFHDRFVVVDNCRFYHLGASVKDLGKKAARISLMAENKAIEDLKGTFTREWEIGKAIP